MNNKYLLLMPVLLLIALLLPLEIPYAINTAGMIMPTREWLMSKTEDGRLISRLQNNLSGTTSAYTITGFEREDAVRFTLFPGVVAGQKISRGDSVGEFLSNDIDREIAALSGKLSIAKARLDLYLEGSKSSVVEEEQQRLALAEQQALEHQKILERVDQLQQAGLASRQEYEIEAGRAKLNELSILIAAAQLRTTQTGAKDQQVDLARSRIHALEAEFEALRQRIKLLTLTSPIDGVISASFSADTLLIISDTSELVLHLLVPLQDFALLEKDQQVKLDNGATARIRLIDTATKQIDGRQVIIAIAMIDHETVAAPLFKNSIGRCRISCKPVTPLEYLKRWLGRA